jgi:NDP-sugar pyrophosphorylase family protein
VTDLDRIEGQFMGLLRFSPDGWRLVEAELARLDQGTRRTLQTTQLLQLLVERGARVAAIPVHGRWCEVDSESDLAIYEAALARPGWRHDWRVDWTAEHASSGHDGHGAGA